MLRRLKPTLPSTARESGRICRLFRLGHIDHPGKDSYRHRQAGAFEVVVASSHRLALLREFEQPLQLSVHQLIAELDGGVDWVLVEGFKFADLPKIEVWRAQCGHPARYLDDEHMVAIATDSPGLLPQATLLPVLDVNDPEALANWLLAQQDRFDYRVENFA